MKENSIEEALKKLSTGKKIKLDKLLRTFKREGIENFVTTRKKYVDVILSDYKRVLKENEELKEENEYNKLLLELNNNFTIDKKTGNYKWNVIEIQKIKDKIEELNKEIKSCTEIDAIFKIKQEQILQELLESE